MSLEDKVLEGLVQIFTRSKTPGVVVQIRDSLPIPPYEIHISPRQFFDHMNTADLSVLSLKSLVDLAILYNNEIGDSLKREMNQRKKADPGFSEILTREFTSRLRKPDDPAWRFEPGA